MTNNALDQTYQPRKNQSLFLNLVFSLSSCRVHWIIQSTWLVFKWLTHVCSVCQKGIACVQKWIVFDFANVRMLRIQLSTTHPVFSCASCRCHIIYHMSMYYVSLIQYHIIPSYLLFFVWRNNLSVSHNMEQYNMWNHPNVIFEFNRCV